MSKDVLTDVLVRREHGWMLHGRRIWYSMHYVQRARPGWGAAVLAHSLGVMARQEELVAWHGLQDRHTPSRGRRPVVERRARDSLADGQSHGMYLANLIMRLWLRPGLSAHAGKVGQHLACREARRVSAVSGDFGVSPSIVIYYINDPGLCSKQGGKRQPCAVSYCVQTGGRTSLRLLGVTGMRRCSRYD
jgi:hypothetical protein